ncbi:MAG TPA: RNA-binding protein [Planctomycetes bacterium]|nr:RNA-binding protein [Planctomycetota bacterium]HIN79546.1 RNA-binding protein [Planctomycetota bacterium]
MAQKVFVGGLPWAVDSDQLRAHFDSVGDVVDAVVIMDRDTGRSKGFGFVEFGSDESASAAIEQFDGTELGGRSISVREAQPRPPRGPR